MTNQTFKLENRINPIQTYDCPKAYNLTRNHDVFTLSGKQGLETYVFRFRENKITDTLAEIRRKVYDKKDKFFFIGFVFRDIINQHLVD